MNHPGKKFWLGILFLFSLTAVVCGQKSAVRGGVVRLDAKNLQAGAAVDLTGDWFYRAGYEVGDGERPERIEPRAGDRLVGVPQFLNQVRWWLDDSEDFKRHEAARLKKLGFDTDRAEDGWYKLTLDAPALPRGKRAYVEFEGVAMKSRVFLNGRELGAHTGMFSRFAFDLTPHLKPGKNLLAVYVSMERIPVSTASLGQAVSVNLTASKVLSLSKGMFGPLEPVNDNRAYDLHGIWQPVKLVVRGEGKLDDVHFMPSLTGAKVEVEASSAGGSAAGGVVKARWVDPNTGKLFARAPASNVRFSGGKARATLELRDVRPKLWTPADPNLYRLEVSLETTTGEVLDRFTHKVGFRTFEARGNQLYLNGRRYWLRGANHLPYGKNPWDARLARKLIRQMHDNNQRVTRTHATPWNEAWLDAADEIGLGVSIEGIRPWAFVGKIGATPPELFEHWLMENGDVVRRIRNHPSVLIWTVGNEMLLRDNENSEKWGQLSAVVKQTRELDPTRPVIVSSSYVREAELYNKVIKPNNVDDGDIDAMHSYRGWYADSPFVSDSQFERELRGAAHWKRPFIGQEMSTGYPDLDTGLPVLRYTKNQVTPQAWVGVRSYPGSDPAFFLEHQRAVTKRWAEQLRFQRGDKTAGFMLFANECWFSHSYDAQKAAPYPVVEAVKYAWVPVGLALETPRRRFYAGESVGTSVFVTNDDEQFRDLGDLQIEFSFVQNGKRISAQKSGTIKSLAYYQTAQVPVTFKAPEIGQGRASLQLVTRLLKGQVEISRTVDAVEVFPAQPKRNTPSDARAYAVSLEPEVSRLLKDSGVFAGVDGGLPAGTTVPNSVVFLGRNAPLDELKTGGRLAELARGGATVVVFSPEKKVQDLFPDDVLSFRKVNGEFAELETAVGTKFAEDLRPMDLKWWGRKNDWRAMVAGQAHRLKAGGRAREIIRFIPAHGYIAAERIPEQFLTVLFEIPVGKGRVWVCDLDLEESVAVDPAARIFAVNLLRAAADPDSTRNLPHVPTHEEMLAGQRITPKKAVAGGE